MRALRNWRSMGLKGSAHAPPASPAFFLLAMLMTPMTRQHGLLEDLPQQILDHGNAGGQLHRLVQRAELEHEILEALGRPPQVPEHLVEGLGGLVDLGEPAQSRHGCEWYLSHRPHGPVRPRRLEAPSELDDLVHDPAEDEKAADGDHEGEEQAGLYVRALEGIDVLEQIHEEEDRQDSGEREDHGRRLAEAPGARTTSRR